MGKAEQESFYTAADNVVRKKLEVELQADENQERRDKREVYPLVLHTRRVPHFSQHTIARQQSQRWRAGTVSRLEKFPNLSHSLRRTSDSPGLICSGRCWHSQLYLLAELKHVVTMGTQTLAALWTLGEVSILSDSTECRKTYPEPACGCSWQGLQVFALLSGMTSLR